MLNLENKRLSLKAPSAPVDFDIIFREGGTAFELWRRGAMKMQLLASVFWYHPGGWTNESFLDEILEWAESFSKIGFSIDNGADNYLSIDETDVQVYTGADSSHVIDLSFAWPDGGFVAQLAREIRAFKRRLRDEAKLTVVEDV